MHPHNDILEAIAQHIRETTPYKELTFHRTTDTIPLRDITGPTYPNDRIYLDPGLQTHLIIKLENAHLHTLYKIRNHPTTILIYNHDLTDPNSLDQLTEDLTDHWDWIAQQEEEPTPHPSNLIFTIGSPKI